MGVVGVQNVLGQRSLVSGTESVTLDQAVAVVPGVVGDLAPFAGVDLAVLVGVGPDEAGGAVAFGIVGVAVHAVEEDFVVGAGDVVGKQGCLPHGGAVAVGVVGVGFVGGRGWETGPSPGGPVRRGKFRTV